MIIPDALRPKLEQALSLAGDTHTISDVERMIREGKLQYWHAGDSCLLTELVDYPQSRTLHFFLAAGSLDDIRPIVPGVLAWGRAHGCDRASLIGRHGWLRSFLRGDGWTSPMVYMERSL